MDIIQKKVKIFQSLSCPFCQRVKLAMELLNIPYTQHEIDIVNKEQEEEWFQKINPQKTVPALILQDGSPVTESLPFVLKLDTENQHIFSSQNGPNYETAFNIANTQLGKAFFSYMNVWKVAEDKNDAAVQETYNNLQQVLLSLANEYKYENSYFFGSKQHPSLFDVLFFCNLYQFQLIDQLILKKDIFSSENPENHAQLKKLQSYITFVYENLPEFQKITYKLANLPEEGSNFFLKEKDITSPEEFNYEDFMHATLLKKFNLKA